VACAAARGNIWLGEIKRLARKNAGSSLRSPKKQRKAAKAKTENGVKESAKPAAAAAKLKMAAICNIIAAWHQHQLSKRLMAKSGAAAMAMWRWRKAAKIIGESENQWLAGGSSWRQLSENGWQSVIESESARAISAQLTSGESQRKSMAA